MAWRDRLYILAFYPIDEWRKAAYRIATALFFIIVCFGGLLFHAAKADDNAGAELTEGIALSDALSDAIFQHPAQRQSGARLSGPFCIGTSPSRKQSEFIVAGQWGT